MGDGSTMDEVQFIEQATLTITRHDVVALIEIEQILNTSVDDVFVPNNDQQTEGMKWLQYLDHMKRLEKEAQRLFELDEQKSPAERIFTGAKQVSMIDKSSPHKVTISEKTSPSTQLTSAKDELGATSNAHKSVSQSEYQNKPVSTDKKREKTDRKYVAPTAYRWKVDPSETISMQALCELINQQSEQENN